MKEEAQQQFSEALDKAIDAYSPAKLTGKAICFVEMHKENDEDDTFLVVPKCDITISQAVQMIELLMRAIPNENRFEAKMNLLHLI